MASYEDIIKAGPQIIGMGQDITVDDRGVHDMTLAIAALGLPTYEPRQRPAMIPFGRVNLGGGVQCKIDLIFEQDTALTSLMVSEPEGKAAAAIDLVEIQVGDDKPYRPRPMKGSVRNYCLSPANVKAGAKVFVAVRNLSSGSLTFGGVFFGRCLR
jgi:hypothetical protein